jgi:hypothetical protein
MTVRRRRGKLTKAGDTRYREMIRQFNKKKKRKVLVSGFVGNVGDFREFLGGEKKFEPAFAGSEGECHVEKEEESIQHEEDAE